MRSRGILRERVIEAWAEIRENLGRASLQSLGVLLGVASVLGGFSITDSFRKRSEQLYIRQGGLDKLNVQSQPVSSETQPTALRMANLGLRKEDEDDSRNLHPQDVQGISVTSLPAAAMAPRACAGSRPA